MTDISNTPDGAQPDQGQGDGGSGLYAEALNAVPEHLRQHVEPHFKEWDRRVGPKLNEAAEFRKQWEPYGNLGLNEIDPSELQELLQFREIAGDQERFRQWYDAVGEELGFNTQADDPDADLFGLDDGPDIDSRIAEAVQQAVSPLQEAIQQREHAEAVAQAEQQLTAQLDALSKEHGDFDRQRVMQLALAYDSDPEAVTKGFSDYQAMRASIEKQLLEAKGGAPNTPVQGGRTPGEELKNITSFDDAKQAARELVRKSMNA